MRRLPALVLALAAVLGMLFPATAIAQVLYECRMMGTVSTTSCCCKSEKASEADLRHATIDRAPCCDEQVVTAERASASTHALDYPAIPPATLAHRLPARVMIDFARNEHSYAPASARGPPPLGPPLYIEHCALLS